MLAQVQIVVLMYDLEIRYLCGVHLLNKNETWMDITFINVKFENKKNKSDKNHLKQKLFFRNKLVI